MKVLGVDGCKAGWLAVSVQRRHAWTVDVYADAAALWQAHGDARRILVDVPIGLPWRGLPVRRCDLEARRLLGQGRGSSVFPAPSRAALQAKDYRHACRLNNQEVGKKLSKQCYGILPKIRQVDELLGEHPSARGVVREVHPELCFWALNQCSAMANRKTEQSGFVERLRLLSAVFPPTQAIVDHTLQRFRRKDVARDDILDALVAVVTALQPGRLHAIPLSSQRDATGLPMEMVYTERPAC
jgi:predicted RNase H-like nuclease